MTLDPITVAVAVLICVTLWQQWGMSQIQNDLDEVIDKHNEFVSVMLEVLEEDDADYN